MISTTFFAKSTAPSPPFAHTSERATSTPLARNFSLTRLISASVSVGNLFIATTAGTPNLLTFSTCLSMFGSPASKASSFHHLSSFLELHH